ncbi:Response regulator receiver modulated CheW protein [Candidatus Magnetomorum sp. HK-1]|nr:Response regulator receiver modulated CheW protein [Candidatus Magnetomorum sp. HK-1]
MGIDVQMKILIVEDAKVVRKMAVKILKEIGFTKIVEAEDGQVGMMMLKENPDVDIIISDWNMPNKDGYELLTWVRKQRKYDHVPFVMATAQGEKKQIQKASEAGANNYITKPFGPPEMRSTIEKAFEKNTLTDQSNEPQQKIDYAKRTQSGKLEINAAHIQITDHLTLGVLNQMMQTGKMTSDYFSLKTHCMTSWNPVLKALERGEVDVAFVLAPIAMDLFSAGVPIRLILFAHKDGSISVRNKKIPIQSRYIDYFRDKHFYIPHLLSIHHMLAHMFFREMGLNPGLSGTNEKVDVFFEVAPPVQMTNFMAQNEDSCGFMVAEPVGSKAIATGKADLLFHSNDLWEYHPCCVVAVREELIESQPDAVHDFVRLLIEAGDFITENPESAAEIAVPFLDPKKIIGLKQPILASVLTGNKAVKTNDLFPELESLDKIQRYMHSKMNIGSIIDLEKFVDTSFAEAVFKDRQSKRTPSADINITSGVSKVLRKLPIGKAGAATDSDFQLNKKRFLELAEEIKKEVLPLSLHQCMPLIYDLVKVVDNHTQSTRISKTPTPESYIQPIIYAIFQILFEEGYKAETGKLALCRANSFVENADFDFVDVRTLPSGYDILMTHVKGQDFLSLYLCFLIKFLFQKNVRNRQPPESFFEVLNTHLLKHKLLENHVSASYINLNFKQGKGKTITAAHPPVVLLKHSIPMVRAIMGEMFLLGEIDDQKYLAQDFEFSTKDRLFLHSMSIVNAAPKGMLNKKDSLDFIGLDDIFMNQRDKNIEEMLDGVLTDILSHCKNSPSDGMMILGIEVP